jgi:hypothetical protein
LKENGYKVAGETIQSEREFAWERGTAGNLADYYGSGIFCGDDFRKIRDLLGKVTV